MRHLVICIARFTCLFLLMIETSTSHYNASFLPASIISTAPSRSSDKNILSFFTAVLHSSPPDSNLTLLRESIISPPTKVFSIQPVPLAATPRHPPRILFTLRKTSMSTCRITIGSRKYPIVRSPESNVSRRWSLPVVSSRDKVQSNATDFAKVTREFFSAEIKELPRPITCGLNGSLTIVDDI